MGDQIKKINLTEFRDFGFLQEVNRLFFHPLGLALEVRAKSTDEEHTKYEVRSLGGVWDYREDAEGVLFGIGMIDQDKIDRVEKLRQSKRFKFFGKFSPNGILFNVKHIIKTIETLSKIYIFIFLFI